MKVYASNVVLEVVQSVSTGKYFVRALYDDREVAIKVQKPQPQEAIFFPWEPLHQALLDFVPKDYEKECRCKVHDKQHPFTAAESSAVGDTITGTNLKTK